MTAVTTPAATVAVHDSVEGLLAGAEQREDSRTANSLSGNRFERVVIDGMPLIVKYSSLENDWIMRATGDLGGRQLRLLTSPVLTTLPACIDHAIVGCAPFTDLGGSRGVALLMRDVSAAMIPPAASRSRCISTAASCRTWPRCMPPTGGFATTPDCVPSRTAT